MFLGNELKPPYVGCFIAKGGQPLSQATFYSLKSVFLCLLRRAE